MMIQHNYSDWNDNEQKKTIRKRYRKRTVGTVSLSSIVLSRMIVMIITIIMIIMITFTCVSCSSSCINTMNIQKNYYYNEDNMDHYINDSSLMNNDRRQKHHVSKDVLCNFDDNDTTSYTTKQRYTIGSNRKDLKIQIRRKHNAFWHTITTMRRRHNIDVTVSEHNHHHQSSLLLLLQHRFRGGSIGSSTSTITDEELPLKNDDISKDMKHPTKRSTTIKKQKKKDDNETVVVEKTIPIMNQHNNKLESSSSFERKDTSSNTDSNTYMMILAQFVQKQWNRHRKDDKRGNTDEKPTMQQLIKSFYSLQSAQLTFKGIDGAAHQVYQQKQKRSTTKSSSYDNDQDNDIHDEDDDHNYNQDEQLLSVSGRAKRNVERTCAIANGLLSCELCEMIENSQQQHHTRSSDYNNINNSSEHDDITSVSTNHRQVILNITNAIQLTNNYRVNISILVLYEPYYHGNAGNKHGTIEDLINNNNNIEETLLRNDQSDNKNSTEQELCNGRLIIVVHDTAVQQLKETMMILDNEPIQMPLYFVDDMMNRKGNSKKTIIDIDDNNDNFREIASIQPILYQAASTLLNIIEPKLRMYVPKNNNNNKKKNKKDENITTTIKMNNNQISSDDDMNDDHDDNDHNNLVAIHFVGRSLGGGIAAIAAAILNGNIPLRQQQQQQNNQRSKKSVKKKKKMKKNIDTTKSDSNNKKISEMEEEQAEKEEEKLPLQGLGYSQTSAFILGSPPCISSNVPTEYITSIIYGDDIICRTSYDSIHRLIQRTYRAYQLLFHKYIPSFIGKQYHYITDTLSLTSSNIQTHAIGSDGEEMKIVIPGRSYLIRPRKSRLSSTKTSYNNNHIGCSIHEVGTIHLKGGREALRANILWQLNDILLSNSFWKHHQLDSYIHGLDGVQLREVVVNE